MNKVTYFGGVTAFFIVAFLAASSFDSTRSAAARQARTAECAEQLSVHERKFLSAIAVLGANDTSFRDLHARYEDSATPTQRSELFQRLEPLGLALTSKADASNPGLRRAVDEALGALNRRNEVLQQCQGATF